MTEEAQEFDGEEVSDDTSDEAVAVEADEGTDEPEAQEPEAPAKAWSEDDEAEARLFGWKSPDEWQGERPPGYIDNPEEFLSRVQRSRVFKTMSDKLTEQERRAAEQAKRLEDMNAKALERQRRQYETELDRVRKARDQAAEDGDMAAYRQHRDAEQAMLKEAPKADEQQPTKPAMPDEDAAYFQSDETAWLRDDPFLAQAAYEVIERTPGAKALDTKGQVELARKQLQGIYPDRFPKQEAEQPAPKPKPRNTVDPGGLAGGAGAAAGQFGKLPAEARAQFDRFVKEGIFENTKQDKEEYANEYFG